MFWYLGIREEPEKKKQSPLKKEVKVEEELFRITKRPEQITEEAVSISKEKQICLVCKGNVVKLNYICPECRTFYCIKCLDALTNQENACWVCTTPFDESKPVKPFKKEEKIEESVAVGRRKTAVASIRLRRGTGKVDVNGEKLEGYFPLEIQRRTILAPLELEKVGGSGKYDIIIRLKGGGIEGQVVAARLGISRALVLENEELRTDLKGLGYLTRDPRKVERKKYGQPGARKRFQYSKR